MNEYCIGMESCHVWRKRHCRTCAVMLVQTNPVIHRFASKFEFRLVGPVLNFVSSEGSQGENEEEVQRKLMK
jgi:hypothetical protein